MVRSMYSWAAVLAVVAGLFVSSCTKKEQTPEESKVGFASTDAQFSSEGKATLNLAVSPAAASQVSVIIAAGSEAQDGFTAVPATALSFGSSVTIAAGTETVPVEVSVDLEAVEDGQQAVITISAASGATIDSQKATAYIKVVKEDIAPTVDLSGADVWGVIGAFNEWAGDIELTKTADSPEQWEATGVALGGEFKFRGNKTWGDYDLGSAGAVVVGEELALVHKGGNITIEEGVYDIVLYPTELKAIFTVSDVTPTPGEGTLDWKVAYKGLQWVEGYYGEGQLEVFEVSGTDGSYYYPVLVDPAEEGSIIDALKTDAAGFIAQLQQEVTDLIQGEMDYYEEDLEEAMYWVLYNEDNDGPEIQFYGLLAGNYEFAVFPVDETGTLTGEYKAITFDHPEDFLTVYPWISQPNLRTDWSLEWDGWEEGYEGKYFWVLGKAPGAAYVYCEWYSDEELVDYGYGDVAGLLNSYGSDVADVLYSGEYDIEDILTAVDTDGSFEYVINTYSEEGPFKIYIMAFDANGKVLADYGVTELEGEEYARVEWVERTDWAANYDPAYPGAVVATACDADYYIMEVYFEGISEQYDVETIADDAFYYVSSYGLDDCLEYGYAFDSVPGVYNDPYYDVENGAEVYVFGVNEYGTPTGEWHHEVITGVEEVEFTLVPDWSVTPVGNLYLETYNDKEYTMVDIEVNAPGIQYYFAEEDTQDDLDYYYKGTVEGLAKAYQRRWVNYISLGYSVSDFLNSAEDPMTSLDVYNAGLETTIYIIEYDENGAATGRYGATTVTMPDTYEASAPAKASKKIAFKNISRAPSVQKAVKAAQFAKKSAFGQNARKHHVSKFNPNASKPFTKAPAAKSTSKHGSKILHK